MNTNYWLSSRCFGSKSSIFLTKPALDKILELDDSRKYKGGISTIVTSRKKMTIIN